MDPLFKEVATSLIPMVLGAIGTALGWLAKSVWKAKKDLNGAHILIRQLKRSRKATRQRLSALESHIYSKEPDDARDSD